MKNFKIFIVTLVVILGISCKKKEDPKENYEFEINNVDIKDSAKLLMVLVNESEPLSNSAKETKLYMVSINDKVVERTINKNTGENVSNILRPGGIANATNKYMLITFSRHNGSADEAYLVEKKTGALTLLGDNYNIPAYSQFGTLKNDLIIKYDGLNYIYYKTSPISGAEEIIKYDLISNSKISILPDSVENITSFDVDKSGNILADVYYKGTKRYFIAVHGKLVTKLAKKNFQLSYWNGNDGIFRNKTIENTIDKIEFDQASQTFKSITEINLNDYGITNNFERDQSYKVIYFNKTILLVNEKIFEVDNSTKKINQIMSIPMLTSKWVDHSKALGHLYVAGESTAGQETIFNIDLSNYSYKTYPEAGKYTFYEIEAFEDGTIYATAKRKSDSKNVVLKFTPDGTETVLYDQLGTKKGVWLEKVTEFTND